MEERARKSASAHPGRPGARRAWVTAAAPLALFCSVTGVLAVGVGALAAFLVPGGEVRGLVWLIVTVLLAAGAGLWWGLTPAPERLRVLNRALVAAQPRGSQHR